MKLSELVAYRHRLCELRPRSPELILRDEFGPALHEAESCTIQFADLTDQLAQNYQQSAQTMEHFHQTMDSILQEIDRTIDAMQPAYFAESYRLYEDGIRYDSNEHILNRRFNLPPAALEFIRARIRSFGDWHWPAMIIRPGLEDWIQDLVACDPLYLVDKDYDLIQPSLDRFNPEYQRRLRRYVIDESEENILAGLPQAQFGFILAYNLLNYKPLEIVKFYLESAYQCLRAGGVFAFTINDGDKPGGVALAERCYMCYTPASVVKSLATAIGYSIRQIYHADSSNTWIELSRSGTYTSLRGGQALAKILPKAKPAVDIPPPRVYTEQEIKDLQQQAIDLNIDSRHKISTSYSPQKLEYLIQQRKANPK